MSRRELGRVETAGSAVTVVAVDPLGALQLVIEPGRAGAALLGATAVRQLRDLLSAWVGGEGPRLSDGHGRYCSAVYPWTAGVHCLREPHDRDQPHQLGDEVARALGVEREWSGHL